MNHERQVARFYAHGLERVASHHGHYLNFGLWAVPGMSYVQAAECLLARVGERAGLTPASRLLDVGCGMGAQDRFFVERFGCHHIEAWDLVPGHIAVARRHHALERIRYGVADACRLPFASAAFTQVIAVEGIVHFRTRAQFFAEAYRVLDAGGRLAVADFFLARPKPTRLQRTVLRLCTAGWHVPQANVATLDAYRATLTRAGFAGARLEVLSDEVIPGYWREQRRPAVRRAVRAMRGELVGRLAVGIDAAMYALYRMGALGYLVASAQKPPAGAPS